MQTLSYAKLGSNMAQTSGAAASEVPEFLKQAVLQSYAINGRAQVRLLPRHFDPLAVLLELH